MAALDAVTISGNADGGLLVVRSRETPKEAFPRTRDLLSSVKAHLRGVFLNAFDSNAPDYYYSYRYYPYSQGYGPQEHSESPHSDEGFEARQKVAVHEHHDHDPDDNQEL